MSGQTGFSWYPRTPSAMGGSQQTPEKTLSVKTEGNKSFLHVSPDANNANWSIASVDSTTNAGQTWQYGYFEARLRFKQIPTITDWDNTPAAWASLWLTSPIAWQGPTGTKFCEIDIMEQLAGPDVISGTVHEWTQNTNGGHVYTKHEAHRSMEGWHTYGLRWEPGKLSWYLDGVFLMSRTYGKDIAPAVGTFTQWAGSPEESMDALPVGTFSVLDQQRLALILGTGTDVPMDIEYVRVWS